MRVIITDGNFKHTLAAVRSLGRKGVDITVLSDSPLSIAFYSKYCKTGILAPNPEHSSDFAKFVTDFVKNGSYDVLLPISYAAVDQISGIQKLIESDIGIPLPASDALQLAANKEKTMQYAKNIGVPIPKTYYPKTSDEVITLSKTLSYPVVVKGSIENGNVGYANSPDDLLVLYKKMIDFTPIFQEYIVGDGYGFFALYNHGEARAIFMHRRIREYPVTGGPSALAESVYEPRLMELGLKMLDSLRWHGVAMVEFKRDVRTDDFVLMEINPKFWGSLELAIVSGVDFPYLTSKMICKGDIEPVFTYQTGVKFRWLLPQDTFHVITNPEAITQFISDFRDETIHYDINIHDPIPNILQLGMTIGEFFLRIKQRRFWKPHGQPQC